MHFSCSFTPSLLSATVPALPDDDDDEDDDHITAHDAASQRRHDESRALVEWLRRLLREGVRQKSRTSLVWEAYLLEVGAPGTTNGRRECRWPKNGFAREKVLFFFFLLSVEKKSYTNCEFRLRKIPRLFYWFSFPHSFRFLYIFCRRVGGRRVRDE